MEISFPTASASETLLNQAVPSPAVPAVAQVEGEGEASPRAETPAWRTTPRQEPVSAPVPPVLPLAAALSPAAAPPAPSPLGDASSLLATLRATEAQQAPAATMPPLLGMLGTAPAPAGAALSPAGAKPTAPPPLLAALTSPPPVPSATTSPAAAPTGVGEILRRIGQGQPPAPAAAVKPEEPAVPNVLRALRLTGLG